MEMIEKMLNRIALKYRAYSASVAIHSGVFHADDVCCVALLRILFPDIKVVREQKIPDVSERVGFVLDVGMTDEITDKSVSLDHHQAHGNDRDPETGVRPCAFSKLSSLLFSEYPEFLKRWNRDLAYPVATLDNGQTDAGVNATPVGFVRFLNPTWEEGMGSADARFVEGVSLVIPVMRRIMSVISSEISAEELVAEGIRRSDPESGIVIFDRYLPWQAGVVKDNAGKPKWRLAVFPSARGGWMIQTVPVREGAHESWVKLPREWDGANPADLEKMAGVPGAIFSKYGAFASWKDRDGAVAAAKAALG